MKFTKAAGVMLAASAFTLAGCETTPHPADQARASYPGSYPSYPPYQETSRYGYVEAVETIQGDPRSTGPGVGAIGGAIAGGVLGHQVGSGSGNTAATIGGAVIGGVVGHQIEQRVKGNQAGTAYRFRVRMDDGSYQTFTKETHDNIRVGDRVRIEGNNIFLS